MNHETKQSEEWQEERAKTDLSNVVHIWNKIGEEMNPILVAFIQKEKGKSYQDGYADGAKIYQDTSKIIRQEILAEIRRIIEGMKAIGYDRMYIHRESLVKRLDMLK